MNNNKVGIFFVLPALIGTFIFIVIPIFCSFGLSFTEWDLLNEIKFVGLENYKAVFTEPVFFQILINTLVYAICTTIFAVAIPLVIASILNTKLRGAEWFKTIYFIPFITPAVVIAIVWGWIFDPNIGAINTLFHTHLNWLFDTRLAMPVLIFVSVWKLIGYNVVLFLTGFSTINQNVYEAAKIDGAGEKETFFKITLPLLKPTTYFVTLVTAISSFQIFDLIYVMTEGGPKDATNVIVYSIYKYAFEYFDIGKSCALAYILFIVIFVLTLLQKKKI
ncbi:MAG: sugar ABC transporter permease [Candidatus Gastranaerophilales bacterium]|nr:sugar ABC transporter permease [Candidatus Gastranaerophilales bacterium]MCM1072376.1 sugar ABC transporter permease [Bacteroides sp.]